MSGDLLAQGDLVVLEAVTRLAIARGVQADDVQLDVYADTLRDLDPDAVRRACLDLAKLSRSQYDTALPSCGTIRERAEQIARADELERAQSRLLPAPSDDPTEPRFFCLDCRDESSAWRIVWCPGAGETRDALPSARAYAVRVQSCGKDKPHHPHTFAERCPCWETNPVIARRREAERKRNATRAERRSA